MFLIYAGLVGLFLAGPTWLIQAAAAALILLILAAVILYRR